MTEFLTSLKADLLDRRLLPFVALVVIGVVGAVAYVVFGGSSTPATQTPTLGISHVAKGIAVSAAGVNPLPPAAETTSGASAQRQGSARDPFKLLPGAAKTASTAPASVKGAKSTKPATPTTGANVGTGPTPKVVNKPTTPAPSKPKTQTVYHVSVLFGALPTVVPPQGVQLTPYNDLKLLTSLPSAKQPLIVFRGVTAAGKSATFTVVGEAILRGAATCLPSPAQCQEINLKPGQVEQLEYLAPTGQAINYELRIVGIGSTKASSAQVMSIRRGQSNAGREVLRRAGLLAVPGLRYSSQFGVLAFLDQRALQARARAQARRHG
jgi:hypothetical protein